MMILGIGTDLVELGRLQKSNIDRLAKKILTEKEWEIYQSKKQKLEFLGGRFAAKEAISKAFGTGIGEMVGFQDIEVLSDAKGAPTVNIHEKIWLKWGMRGKVHLSISHTNFHAIAFAVIERV